MDIEQKKQRTLVAVKWLGGLAIGFVVAPFVWIAIGGIVGLLVSAAISFVCWKFTGVFAMKIANWRLKALKAEAMKNPVETLQNDYAHRMAALTNFRDSIGRFKGEIENFHGKLDSFGKQYPQERAKFQDQYEKMRELYGIRVRKYEAAKSDLASYELEIQKADAIWQMAQAASKLTQAAGVSEEDLLARIKVETALDSVQKSLHSSFAELELSLMDEKAISQGEAQKALPSPTTTNQIGHQQMKSIITTIILAALGISALAQTKQPFIKGTLDIRYNTRIDADSAGKPKKDVADSYALNLNVSDSALFKGTVAYLPPGVGFIRDQQGKLTFNVDCYVVNPNNPAQSMNIGRMNGVVPIDARGQYRFNEGTFKIGVNAVGRAQAFESKFGGVAIGKPVKGAESTIDKFRRQALSIQKTVRGQTVSLTVTNYDKMSFQNHVLAAGPVQTYSEAKVLGDMVYDYERSAWYFQNIQISYIGEDGKPAVDRVTGNIRWIESPGRSSNGEGEYQFDVRLNEVAASEGAVFTKVSDEASFFQTDEAVSAIVGAMKYKDTMAGDKVTASSVVIDLRGNKVNRHQMMNLAKLLLISCIVPMNAE